MPKIIYFVVLTISDSCMVDPTLNRSGPRLVQLINQHFPNSRVQCFTLPDDKKLISSKLREQVKHEINDSGNKADVIITTGGTGFGERDVTPEATRSVIDRECPQMSMILLMDALKVTRYAALSRGICGIAGHTLIINLPGSEKSVIRGFECVRELIPHAFNLLTDNITQVRKDHDAMQCNHYKDVASDKWDYVSCSCKMHNAEGAKKLQNCGDGDQQNRQSNHHHASDHYHAKENVERVSTFKTWNVSDALKEIFATIHSNNENINLTSKHSPIDVPAFRASIKDGYAMKSSALPGTKKVLAYIAAGDPINTQPLNDDECFKINTGAPLPEQTDCVIQIEHTHLLKTKPNGKEDLVEILVEPKENLDVRPIGCDVAKGVKLFPICDISPVVVRSMLATVGKNTLLWKPQIAILSTGNELLQPGTKPQANRIFDTNTTLLKELLEYFGFTNIITARVTDDYKKVLYTLDDLRKNTDVVICTGGVSMGDKDYIKPVLEQLGYKMHFGRVDMKPGKPMTFSSINNHYFFGLPGNPVSAFVTFHIFVLPALRWLMGYPRDKCQHPLIKVKLVNEVLRLDCRPEYMRAVVTSRNGQLYAEVTGNQMSSRLQSIVGADVLLHLPACSKQKNEVRKDEVLSANTLRYDFISKYEN